MNIINFLDRRAAKINKEIEETTIKHAATIAQRGEVAMKSLAYWRAARLFQEAAKSLPEGHDDMRKHYLVKAETAARLLSRWEE